MTLAGWVQFAKQGVKVAKALLGQSKSGWRPKGGSYRLPPNQQITNIHQASKQQASNSKQAVADVSSSESGAQQHAQLTAAVDRTGAESAGRGDAVADLNGY